MIKIAGQLRKMPDDHTQIFVATIKVRDLVAMAKVDVWQHFEVDGVTSKAGSLPGGYQRPELDTVVSGMLRGIENGGFFHGVIVGNIRPNDLKHIKVSGGSLEVQEGTTLWLIDGQQRTAALRRHLQTNPRYGKTEVQVHIYLGGDASFEGKAFLLMNLGKTVPSDLRERLVSHFSYDERRDMIAGRMPGISSSFGQKLAKEAQAIDILDALKLYRSPIYDYIRRPNEDNTAVPLKQHSFVRSLTETFLFSVDSFGDHIDGVAAEQARIINIFWDGVKMVWPQPFDEKGLTMRQRRYSLISAVSFIAMHTLLAEMLKSWEGEFTAQRVAAILSRAKGNLNTDFWTRNNPKDPMIGNSVEFWSSMNPMIRHKGNSEVRKELYAHIERAITGDASLETVIRETLKLDEEPEELVA